MSIPELLCPTDLDAITMSRWREAEGLLPRRRIDFMRMEGGASNQSVEPLRSLSSLQALATDARIRVKSALGSPQPLGPSFGEIWTTLPAPDDVDERIQRRLVAALDDEGTDGAVLVAPLSLQTAYRGPADLLVPPGESPLGGPYMIEVWNAGTLLRAQIGRCLGVLEEPSRGFLALLRYANFGSKVDLTPVRDRVGPPIENDADPRLEFQEEEIASCWYLWQPYLRALEAYGEEAARDPDVASLGQMVAANEQRLAPLISETQLDRLKEVRLPLAAFLVAGRRNRAVLQAAQAARITGEALIEFRSALVRALNVLTSPSDSRRRPAYTRQQRRRRARR